MRSNSPSSRIEPDAGERVDWFLEEVTAVEDGAIVAFHYLFARYAAWRGRYGLLKSALGEVEFAAAIESCSVRTDYERKLFFDIRTRASLSESFATSPLEPSEPPAAAAEVVDADEAGLIATKLVKLYRDGAIAGPGDPNAVRHAVRIRDERRGIVESHTDIAGSDAPVPSPAAPSAAVSFSENKQLFGFDETERIVAVEFSASEDLVEVFMREPDGSTTVRREKFSPFLWALPAGTPPDAERLLQVRRFPDWQRYKRARNRLENEGTTFFTLRDPVQQYLTSSGRTLFKGMRFEDLRRLQIDIETGCAEGFEFSNAERDPVLAIALSDSTDWEQIIVVEPDSTESERAGTRGDDRDHPGA